MQSKKVVKGTVRSVGVGVGVGDGNGYVIHTYTSIYSSL